MTHFGQPSLLKSACTVLATPLLSLASFAQAGKTQAPGADLALTYVSERSLLAGSSQSFWMEGGAAELGLDAWHGLGVAVDLTGTHSASVGSGDVPLSMITVTFGPRYRCYIRRRVSLYGEGLLGEANGFRSLFPNPQGAQSSSNSMAVQVGGGLDIQLRRNLAIRAVDAGWVRTQMPNSTNNTQNVLKLGSGLVLRFGR
jgi:opacity protein-like surface antigen